MLREIWKQRGLGRDWQKLLTQMGKIRNPHRDSNI